MVAKMDGEKFWWNITGDEKLEINSEDVEDSDFGHNAIVAIYGSNEYPIEYQESIIQAVEFTSDDEGVAMVLVIGDGTLSIVGLATGTTHIQVARIAGTWAPRRPNIPALIVTPLEVVVS